MANPSHIIVSAAHHVGGPDEDPGTQFVDAEGRLWREADWSAEMAGLITARLADRGATVTLIEQPLGATIRAINTVYADAALVIEPHLNAPAPEDPAREYGAVIVSGHTAIGGRSLAFAAAFTESLRAARIALRWPLRVESWATGTAAYPRSLGLLDRSRPPAVITEAAFLGSYGGALWDRQTLEWIADAHVAAAVQALRRASPYYAPESAP